MKILNAYAGIGGKDLFTQGIFRRAAIHVATNIPIILLRSAWYKGVLS